MKLNDYKCSKEQFENMTTLEKRTYILQEQQENTNWWLTVFATIQVVAACIGGVMLALYIIFSINK